MAFPDEIKKAKDRLKEILTPENTEKLTAIDAVIDRLSEDYSAVVRERDEIKDSYLAYVKNYSFKTPDPMKDDPTNDKDIDDILADSLEEIISKRGK